MKKSQFAVNTHNMRALKKPSILLFLLFLLPALLFGQDNAYLQKLMRTPFVSNLKAYQEHEAVLFSIYDNGKRNVCICYSPEFIIDKLTGFDKDDGQEITNIHLSADGRFVIFVMGGDHGSNSSPVPVNPGSSVKKQEIAIYSVEIASKRIIKLDNGDFPVVHPSQNRIVYIKSNQLWTTSVEDPMERKQLFEARGAIGSPVWSPDGNRIAFVSRRNTHSFVGIYEEGRNSIEWVSPSLHTDNTPRWSPDGSSLAFIRRRATGGELDSLTAAKPVTWEIMKYDLGRGKATSLYSSPGTPRGSLPSVAGGTNLNWPLQDNIVFVSYKDGWPHLYKLDVNTKEVTQQTAGDFEIGNLSYNRQGNRVLFSANNGKEPEDRDRKHIGIIDLDLNKFEMMTDGPGIEVSPLFLTDNEIVYLKGGVKEPFLPCVKERESGKTTRLGSELVDFGLYKDFVVPQQVIFTSPDGVKLHGQLFNLDDGKKGKPALVYIHGGPRRQMYLGWHNVDYYHFDYMTNQYLASQGFVVLSVNYRRGTGYGFDFQNPPHAGPLGSQEYLDILAAGKWLQECGYADPGKIGLYGGSYGGTLTAMGLGRNSDVFKYGVDIHGRHNRELSRNIAYYPPDFELAAKIAWDSSPSKYVDSWTSPVLLIHGDDDQNVPFQQSIDLYNRLIGKGVEVEVLVIPDETHHWMVHRNLEKIKQALTEYLMNKAF